MIKYFAGYSSCNEFECNEKEYKNYKYWKIEYRNKNNILHREDGPAREYSFGHKVWYKNGKLHREDGPAIEFINRYKSYYFNAKFIDVQTDKEFKEYIKMKVFL
jgi:hypothetical protein